jgi:hypothetical protein
MGTDPAMTHEAKVAAIREERRCRSYTVRGHRCKRQGTCWSVQSGRLCVQHMREAEPRNLFWLT